MRGTYVWRIAWDGGFTEPSTVWSRPSRAMASITMSVTTSLPLRMACVLSPSSLMRPQARDNGERAVDVSCQVGDDIAADAAGNLYLNPRSRTGIWKLSAKNGVLNRMSAADFGGSGAGSLVVDGSGAVHAIVQNRLQTLGPEGFRDHQLQKHAWAATAVAVDRSGILYQADWRFHPQKSANYRIWKYQPDGAFDLIASFDHTPVSYSNGPTSDVYPGTIAHMAAAPNGDLDFVDRAKSRIRKVTASSCAVERRPAAKSLSASAFGAPLDSFAVGTLFRIYGSRLGPTEPAYAELDEQGRVAKQAGGTRVLFNGAPAPLTYAQDGQVNGAVPFDLWGRREAEVVVEADGRRGEPFRVSLQPAAPGIFGWLRDGDLDAAMINQDGTVNGPDNAAAPGSIVTVFATGAGQTEPGDVDGQIAGSSLPKPIQPVRVIAWGDDDAEVLYAGAAPGMIEGVIQVNFRVPKEKFWKSRSPLRLIIGDYGMRIAIQFYSE
jgi:uncharacterized protein (TIGR03437 family)